MIEFPILTNSRCRLLRACGRLVTKDARILERLKALEERKFAATGDPPKQYIAVWGAGPYENHLHIDIVSANFVKQPLKTTSTVAELADILSEFLGQSINVKVTGRFTVPISELPERGLIRGTLLEMTSGEMGIKQSGGTFTISRGPVERVEWTLSDSEPNAVDVELAAEKTVPFDSVYLLNLLDFMTTAFDTLIIGRSSNEIAGI